jgi:hypothetical protein
MYKLTIYAGDARSILRETTHTTEAQAYRSRNDYERRHGQRCASVVSALPMPACDDTAGWDEYHQRDDCG